MTGDTAIVVIGRNEGARLRACLESARAEGVPIVYVDSGSSDGSPALAAAMGVRAVALERGPGFCAARARNRGLAELAGDAAPPAFVQVLDGDCVLAPGWIVAARARLGADPGLAAVAGRRHERAPEATIFNRLCDMEWAARPGPARAVGGDAMFRVSAFEAVGGFDPGLICGEEPDLCYRLRRAGWRVERLDREMTLHDAAMTRWSQWARRATRTGWAFAEGAARHGAGPERYNVREHRSIWIWGGAWPGALGLSLAAAGALAAAGGPWGWALAAAGALAAGGGLQALRIARGRRARHGDPWRHAVLYGAMTLASKPLQLLGALRHARARRRGQAGRLIEYKGAGGAGA